jgi:hypothetical protein
VLSIDKIRNKDYTLMLAESLCAPRRPGRRGCRCLKSFLTTTRRANRGNGENFLFESAVTH